MTFFSGPVFIVDDELEVRDSLKFMLDSFGYETSTFASASAFITNVDFSQIGCVILDSRMPEMLGQELHRLMVSHDSILSVIFLTGHGDVPMAVEAFKEGAVDFFQKPVDGDLLSSALQKGLCKSTQLANKKTDKGFFNSLTKRERQVLKLVSLGYKNQKMADELFVSLRTIEVHRAHIMQKLNCSNMAELMLIYGEYIKQMN